MKEFLPPRVWAQHGGMRRLSKAPPLQASCIPCPPLVDTKTHKKTHPEWIKDLNVSAHTIELGENPGLTLPELELGSGFLDAQNTNNKGKKKKIHDIIKI